MVTVEPDEVDEPTEVGDPIGAALGSLIEVVVEATEAGSLECAQAMGEVLALPARIRAVISRPRLN
jgi:hypothetical protein